MQPYQSEREIFKGLTFYSMGHDLNEIQIYIGVIWKEKKFNFHMWQFKSDDMKTQTWKGYDMKLSW
jgi:hypothetical protein